MRYGVCRITQGNYIFNLSYIAYKPSAYGGYARYDEFSVDEKREFGEAYDGQEYTIFIDNYVPIDKDAKPSMFVYKNRGIY